MTESLLESLKVLARNAVFLRNEADAAQAVQLAYDAGMLAGERKGFDQAVNAALRSLEAKREGAA